ncbi:reductase [Rhodobacteraceae bacterium CH30]|nr:reductase [Rhodobacteraceae bacterium CH30]
MLKRPLTLVLLASFLLYGICSVWAHGWPADYWAWRSQLRLVSGVMLLAVMAGSMLLAMRPMWLERAMGGLDKLYAQHKRFGIASGLLLGAHWLIELSPKLFVAMQWAEPKIRRAGGGGARDPLVSLAKDMGEWAAWLMLGMVLLALLRALPYRIWRPSHKLFAPIALAGVFHGLMLADKALWLTPAGALLALLLLFTTLSALWSLSGRIGRSRRHRGHITAVHALPGQSLEVCCSVAGWPGHKAGQFALVSFDAGEGAHPFTIASAERQGGELRFIIKALGDYTATLPSILKVGDGIEVEGPYGCFDHAGSTRQAWVAGGIGITPFLAWLEARTQTGDEAPVDFYYCVRNSAEAAALDEVRAACLHTGVTLHLIESDQGARLDVAMLPEVDAVWFCGPAGMGDALARGLAARQQAPVFHREAFSMR